jgi:MFS family permease
MAGPAHVLKDFVRRRFAAVRTPPEASEEQPPAAGLPRVIHRLNVFLDEHRRLNVLVVAAMFGAVLMTAGLVLWVVLSIVFAILKLVFGIGSSAVRLLFSGSLWRFIVALALVAGLSALVHNVVRTLAVTVQVLLIVAGVVLVLYAADGWLQLFGIGAVVGLIVGLLSIPLIPYFPKWWRKFEE